MLLLLPISPAGADVDLALIDLPGIIQTEQADNGSNVELVQQLVKHYISSSRAIIVATITCKDDIDNQVRHCYSSTSWWYGMFFDAAPCAASK
jgi:hypothetical protein